jgi:hypothetical protein
VVVVVVVVVVLLLLLLRFTNYFTSVRRYRPSLVTSYCTVEDRARRVRQRPASIDPRSGVCYAAKQFGTWHLALGRVARLQGSNLTTSPHVVNSMHGTGLELFFSAEQ